jgi:hypothetical protein
VSRKLSKDRPIRTVEEDAFGLSGFANALATSLLQMSPEEGLVLSVEGPWGSGKSSAIALTSRTIQSRVLTGVGESLDELEKLSPTKLDERWEAKAKKRDVHIIRFNPWNFSGQENLVRAFFRELETQITGKSESKLKRAIGGIADQLPSAFGALASLVATAVGQPAAAGAAGAGGKVAGEGAKKLLGSDTSLEGAKRALENELREAEQRIIVIIDDIDRLMPTEMRAIFSLVKSLGDLPCILYVLAFDRAVVTSAFLNGTEKIDPEFLEKVIQVSLKLPVPWREELRDLLITKLNTLIGDAEPTNKRRWDLMYRNVVDRYLETPRDVVRLVNTLQVIWPNVEGDVDLTDLIGLTTLQLFDPQAYDLIAGNIEIITYADYRYEDDKEFGARLEPKTAKKPDIAREAMALMFPRLAKVWSMYSFDNGSYLATSDQRRICTTSYHRNYFQFARSSRRLSKSEIEALLAADDAELALDRILKRLVDNDDGRSPPRLAMLLDQILETTQPRPLLTPQFARALLKRGDELIQREDAVREMYTRDNLDRLEGILRRGLEPLDANARKSVLEVYLKEPACVSLRSDVIEDCARQHGLYGGKEAHNSEVLFPKELIEPAAHAIISQIAEICSTGAVFDLPFPLPIRLIWRWRRMTGSQTLKPWFQDVLKNRSWTLRMADALPGRSYRSGGPNGSEVVWTFKRADFIDCFDIEALLARVEQLAKSDTEAVEIWERLRRTENA